MVPLRKQAVNSALRYAILLKYGIPGTPNKSNA